MTTLRRNLTTRSSSNKNSSSASTGSAAATLSPGSTVPRQPKRRREENGDDDDEADHVDAPGRDHGDQKMSAVAARATEPKAKRQKRVDERKAAFVRAQAARNGVYRGPVVALGSRPLATATVSTTKRPATLTTKKPAVSARVAAAGAVSAKRPAVQSVAPAKAVAVTDNSLGRSKVVVPERAAAVTLVEVPTFPVAHSNKASPIQSKATVSHVSEVQPFTHSNTSLYRVAEPVNNQALKPAGQTLKPVHDNKINVPPPSARQHAISYAPTSTVVSTAPGNGNISTSHKKKDHIPIANNAMSPVRTSPPKQPFQSPVIMDSRLKYHPAVKKELHHETPRALPILPSSTTSTSGLNVHADVKCSPSSVWHLQKQPQQKDNTLGVNTQAQVSSETIRSSNTSNPPKNEICITPSEMKNVRFKSELLKHVKPAASDDVMSDDIVPFALLLEAKKKRIRRDRADWILQLVGMITITLVFSHILGIFIKDWDTVVVKTKPEVLTRRHDCFHNSPALDSADGSFFVEECAAFMAELTPCPPGGICVGGILRDCISDYMVIDGDPPCRCVLSESVNETAAEMKSLLHRWTVDHYCLPGGVAYTVNVANHSGRPLFEYSQLAGTVEKGYDLALIEAVNELDPTFDLEQVGGHILIGLDVSQRLSIPATCQAKLGILAVFSGFFQILKSIVSVVLFHWITFPFFRSCVFCLTVFWGILMEAPVTTVTTLTLGLLLSFLWRRRRQRLARREQISQDIARTKLMVRESLKKYNYEHRVDTVCETIKRHICSEGSGKNVQENEKVFDKIVWPRVVKSIQADAHIHTKQVRQGTQNFYTWQWIETLA